MEREAVEEYKKRAADLVAQMTLEEKVFQTLHGAPAIERLGIPAYNWWNEALHGVARAGTATVFPQAIGLAAAWDGDLMQSVGDTVSTEGRAKYNMQSACGDRDIYKGLTFWAPNVNIFRDPRWGRGHETLGEDPYLTSTLAVRYIRGIQGDDERFLKAAACAKHFAVHSGPEEMRHYFDAVAGKQDMGETYLPAFEACVKEAGVETVMGAYNRTNGEPCCGSRTLLVDLLRGEWGFDGHVTSDCWAIKDFHENHKVTHSAVESVSLAMNNGCDLNCGNIFIYLKQAVEEGRVEESRLDEAVTRLLTTRMKLGLFEEEGKRPYTQITYDFNDTERSRAMAEEAALAGIVLLKNKGNLLPLDIASIKTIGVIGPNGDNRRALVGNYEGTASEYVTVLDGIREYVRDWNRTQGAGHAGGAGMPMALAGAGAAGAAGGDGKPGPSVTAGGGVEASGAGVRVLYSEGCHMFKDRVQPLGVANDRISEVKGVCALSDVVVAVMGLDAGLEGEEGDTGNAFASGDKPDLNLPGLQGEVLEAIVGSGKPAILVVLSGSALALGYADEHIPSILQGWYPGAQGGRAIAKLIFGERVPEGKLPVTFYRTTEELPDFTDYSMENRTYRYMKQEALYPFGFGLSYTSFEMGAVGVAPYGAHGEAPAGGDGSTCALPSALSAAATKGNTADKAMVKTDSSPTHAPGCAALAWGVGDAALPLTLSAAAANGDLSAPALGIRVPVKNTGRRNAAQVVQVYVKALRGGTPGPQLKGFAKVWLVMGETKDVEITLPYKAFSLCDGEGKRSVDPGSYKVYVGFGQPDSRTRTLTGQVCAEIDVEFGE